MSERPTERDASTDVLDWEDPSSLPVTVVRDLFLTLSKALRSYQLYDRNNPIYRRFVSNLKEAFARVWETRDELQILVEEERLVWTGEEVYRAEERSGSLAFMLYRDGIRDFTLERGIEEKELEQLLDVLHRVRATRDEEDDLVTLLWDLDFHHLEYSAVDLLPEGTLLRAEEADPDSLDARAILEGELGGDEALEDEAGSGGASSDATVMDRVHAIRPEDFNPTLYALDERERSYLEDLYRKEMARNVRQDVVFALFDRLEDDLAADARQEEIIAALRQLLPAFLGQGRLRHAAQLLRELEAVRERSGDEMAPGALQGIEQLLEEFSSPEAVRELVRAVEEGAIRPDREDLALLLRYLRPSALGPLLARVAEVNRSETRRAIDEAVRTLATGEEDRLTRFLGDPDPAVVAGAVRLVGSLQHRPAAPELVRLLEEGPPEVQHAVLEATRRIPTSTLAQGLERHLAAPDRDVRIGAVRVLAEIQYTPAAKTIRRIVEGRDVRGADLSEKMAFFSALADLAGDDAIQPFDRILNHRSLLGRREPSELRACAALALGRIGGGRAREVLLRAEGDEDPVVRSAVRRAANPEPGEGTDG